LKGTKVNSEIEALDLLLNALLRKAAQIQDPVKKKFLEAICNSALRCELLEPKAKAYVCAVRGLKDEGQLQEFMRHTTALLEAEQGLPEAPGRH
jgi:hypothetical protein